MDSRIIEVAIGLVLVFAMAGMMVSAVHEIWVSARKSRGDSLLLAVCSLLGDNRVTRLPMRGQPKGLLAPSDFTNALMSHPLLLSQILGGDASRKRPSYLNADVFVSALLGHLCDLYMQGARPSTPREFVNQVAEGAGKAGPDDASKHPTTELVGALRSLLAGAEQDWASYEKRLCSWYDAVMERARGWFRRDTQVRLIAFGTFIAAVVNLNPFVIAPRLWTDPQLRALTTEVATQSAKAYANAAQGGASAPDAAADSARAASAALEAASAARAAAELLASRTRPVASARSASAPAATGQRAESMEVDHAWAALRDALEAAVQAPHLHPVEGTPGFDAMQTLRRVNDLQEQLALRRTAMTLADPATRTARVLDDAAMIESLVSGLDKNLPPGHQTVKDMLARLRTASIAERDAMLPADARPAFAAPDTVARASQACQAPDIDEASVQLCTSMGGLQAVAGIGLPMGWSWANWPLCGAACQARHKDTVEVVLEQVKDSYAVQLAAGRANPASAASAAALRAAYGQSRDQWREALRKAVPQTRSSPWWSWIFDADAWNGLLLALVGWLLMGFAASLGAPFWFDLLGHLVKLRGSSPPVRPGRAAGEPAGDNIVDGGGGVPSGPEGVLSRSPSPPPPPAPPTADDLGAVNAAERDLKMADIVRIQAALQMPAPQQTGRLDADTRQAITSWQAAQGATVADGMLTAAQVGTLLATAAAPAQAPLAAVPLMRTHLRSNGTINVLREDEVRTLFGDIATEPDPANPGQVRITQHGRPGGSQHVLVDFTHPLVLALPGGAHLRVHAKALQHFNAVFDEIAQTPGLAGDLIKCGGTFVPRHIGSKTSKPLSRHTWGIAIDLNPDENPLGQSASLGAGTLKNIVPVFTRHGFAWGGDFVSGGPDPMHFELALLDPGP